MQIFIILKIQNHHKKIYTYIFIGINSLEIDDKLTYFNRYFQFV